ncbi:hypothetical protein ACFWN2_12600 [Lentzea sp. NPDC058436]|uniref:hypothetical protein n=1 Tax=Lentzea sp. NPDC058436 TaxID=3346499 RepID=UPI0036513F99
MPTSPSPSPGCVVTYLNTGALHPATYVHGVVNGTHVVDPETGRSWMPVLLADRSITVVDTAYILRVRPADPDGSPV